MRHRHKSMSQTVLFTFVFAISSLMALAIVAAENTQPDTVRQIEKESRAIATLVQSMAEQSNRALRAARAKGLTGSLHLTLVDIVTHDERTFRELEVSFHLRGGEILAARAQSPRFNKGDHQIEYDELKFDGQRLHGPMRFRIMPDGWVPASNRPADLHLTIDLQIDQDSGKGRYQSELGPGAAEARQVARQGDIRARFEPVPDHDAAEQVIQLPELKPDQSIQAIYQAALKTEVLVESLYRRARVIDIINGWSMDAPSALAGTIQVSPARPEKFATEQEAQAVLADIAHRLTRIRKMLDHAAARTLEPVAYHQNHVAPADTRFGPWYPVSPLPEDDDGIAELPDQMNQSGVQQWQYIRHWQVHRDLPRIGSTPARSIWLPELITSPRMVFQASSADPEQATLSPSNRVDTRETHTPFDLTTKSHLMQRRRLTAEGRFIVMPDRRMVASTQVVASRSEDVWIAVGFRFTKGQSGRGQLWINGQLVWSGWENHPPDDQAYAVFQHKLNAGRNHLVFAAEGMGWNAVEPYLMLCTQGSPLNESEIEARDQAIAKVASARREAHASILGFRGDGSGHYPEATPPIAWDLKTGTNVQWKRDMAGHTTSSPLVVGDRLFTMNDPYTLLCLDKLTGKTLWTREVNPFETFGEAEANKARELWLEATKPESFEPGDKYAEAFLNHARQLGHPVDDATWGLHWQPVGPTHPTPVSDGKHLWVRNAHGAVACYDLEGNRRWFRRIPNMKSLGIISPLLVDGLIILEGVDPEMDAESLRTFFEKNTSGRWMMALDAETGETRWRTFLPNSPFTGDGGFGDPAVVHLSNGEVSASLIVTSYSLAVRARDGKIVLPSQNLQTGGTRIAQGSVTVEGDTAYWLSFDRHGGAIRYHMLDADTFGAQRLWFVATLHNSHGATVKDGTAYDTYFYSGPNPHKANIPWAELFGFDAETGVLENKLQPLHRSTGWPLTAPLATRDFLFVHTNGSPHGDRRDAMTIVRVDRETPSHVWVRNWLYEIGYPDSHRQTLIRGFVTGLSKMANGITHAIPDEDRLYVRLRHTLYSFGYTGEQGRRYEAETIADTLREEIPPRPPVARQPREIQPATTQVPDHGPRPAEFRHLNIATNWLFSSPLPKSARPELLFKNSETGKSLLYRPTNTFSIGDQQISLAPMEQAGLIGEIGDNEDGPGPDSIRGRIDMIKAGAANNATILLYALYYTEREMLMKYELQPRNARTWLAGQPLKHNETIRLKPGYYPMLIEIRIPPALPFKSYVLRPVFHELTDDQAEWIKAVVRHADGLRYLIKTIPDTPAANLAQSYLKAADLPTE